MVSLALLQSSQEAAAQGHELMVDSDAVIRRLVAGEEHSYQVDLDARYRYLLEAEQNGIDIVVEAGTAGDERLAVDAPAYRQGRETLLLPALAAGKWLFLVRSASPASGPGEYRLKLRRVEGAVPGALAANEALTEVGELNFSGSAADRRRAVGKLQEALLIWRSLDDRAQEARALFGLGPLDPQGTFSAW